MWLNPQDTADLVIFTKEIVNFTHFISMLHFFVPVVSRCYRNERLDWIGLTLSAPIPQNGQTHSNNSSDIADELFECLTIL